MDIINNGCFFFLKYIMEVVVLLYCGITVPWKKSKFFYVWTFFFFGYLNFSIFLCVFFPIQFWHFCVFDWVWFLYFLVWIFFVGLVLIVWKFFIIWILDFFYYFDMNYGYFSKTHFDYELSKKCNQTFESVMYFPVILIPLHYNYDYDYDYNLLANLTLPKIMCKTIEIPRNPFETTGKELTLEIYDSSE